MNPVIGAVVGVALAILVYPGLLAALVAAWILSWVRGAAQGALQGSSNPGPLRLLGELRAEWQQDAVVPEGVAPALLTVGTWTAVLAPLLALILLPVPGNPAIAPLGLTGDLVAEGALLLGVPLARLLLGWAIPSPYTRLAADRDARLLAGAVVPMALALAATAEQVAVLGFTTAPTGTWPPAISLIARILAAAAFACTLPVLARVTALREGGSDGEQVAGELTELSGRDLLAFRVGEALQLVAVAAVFVAAFVLPILTVVTGAMGRGVIWLVGVLLAAASVGLWEGWRASQGRSPREVERPPLTWWLGLPALLALAALVAAAWASRIG
jgi:formate hydrogenlyase subunit 4